MRSLRPPRAAALAAFLLTLAGAARCGDDSASQAAALSRLLDEKASSVPEAAPSRRAPTAYDAGWFTDAEELPAGPAIAGVDLSALPADKRGFCGRSHQDVLDGFRSRSARRRNALAFDNPKGDLGTGLCWMHSRFQRSAAYLARFLPDKPRPDAKQARSIIRKLSRLEDVVEIGGYEDLAEFSKDYEAQITRTLNSMGSDCVANADCAKRLGDAWTEDAAALKGRMDHLYERMIRQPRLVFLRIKLKSHGAFVSHSLLVVAMRPLRAEPAPNNPLSGLRADGYTLAVLDPNDAAVLKRVVYRYGDVSTALDDDPGLFNEDFDGDFVDFEAAIKRYCRPG